MYKINNDSLMLDEELGYLRMFRMKGKNVTNCVLFIQKLIGIL